MTSRRAHRLLPCALSLIALLAMGASLGSHGAARAASDEPSVSAVLVPSRIAPGDTARLAVTISGSGSAPAPAIPAVDGLEVSGGGQQMSMQIVNGRTAVEVTHSFLLRAKRVGEFTIPALRVVVDGRALSTDPVTLYVSDSPGASAPAAKGGTRAPGGETGEPEKPALATLEVLMPQRDLYVGELVPATLRLLVREGLRVSEVSQPTFEGSAFTITRDPQRQPEQTSVEIGGARWHSVSFPVAVSPVTAGEHALDVRMDLQALIPRTRPRGRGRAGAFGDPFFDSFFDGFVGGQPQKLTVGSEPRPLRVLPLPEEGRPADFSGGIGRFTIAATVSPPQVTAGDPVTLSVTIGGEGNFDRVNLTPLQSGPDWKTYPPSSKFEPSDGLGIHGRKVFEQAVIPQHSGISGVPPRSFSYFDPEARRYATISTQSLALVIAPGSAPATAAVRPSSRRDDAPSDGGIALAPNQVAPGRLSMHLAPVATRPWFLALQALPVLGLVCGFLWIRRSERRAGDLAHHRSLAAAREVLGYSQAMAAAVADGDGAAFFAAARRAVQVQVAASVGGASAALTMTDVASILAGRRADGEEGRRTGPDAELVERIGAIFAAADAVSYARHGGTPDGADLRDWERRVHEVLRSLGAPA